MPGKEKQHSNSNIDVTFCVVRYLTSKFKRSTRANRHLDYTKKVMRWISVEKELPEVNKKVKLSYGLFGTRGAVCDDWTTTGWLTKSGVWSIKWIEGSNMHKMSKPDHWAYLDK